MANKINALAAVVFISFILIVGATGENGSESHDTANETLLSHNDTAANNSPSLNTDIAVNGSIGTDGLVNASQNKTNETEISSNTGYLNTPGNNNADLSNALNEENTNIRSGENLSIVNKITTESSETAADNAPVVAAEEYEDSAKEVTASFGVYLEIVG